MSFILNALRKSEQERQALQSETVTDKILLSQPPQSKNNTTKLFVFLIIANVLIIAGFAWFIRNSLMSTTETPTPNIPTRLTVQETKLEPKATDKPIQPETPPQKTESETASIAELIDGEKREITPLPVTKKSIAETIKQPAMTKTPKLPVSAISATKVQQDEPETIARTGIPFLTDLPKEFRQRLPKLTINVFVYSQIPEERFIIVDMVKYKTGQQIKDAMLLKEILPDSFVVDYQNRIFKIKRP